MSKCKGCGAEITWAIWAKSGKRAPFDIKESSAGKAVLWKWSKGGESEIMAAMYPDAEHPSPPFKRYDVHFSTCPGSDGFRKGKKPEHKSHDLNGPRLLCETCEGTGKVSDPDVKLVGCVKCGSRGWVPT